MLRNKSIEQLWELLHECGTGASTSLIVQGLLDLLPAEEIDRLYKVNELQEILRLLHAIADLLKEKKKEAKARGVKSFYGN